MKRKGDVDSINNKIRGKKRDEKRKEKEKNAFFITCFHFNGIPYHYLFAACAYVCEMLLWLDQNKPKTSSAGEKEWERKIYSFYSFGFLFSFFLFFSTREKMHSTAVTHTNALWKMQTDWFWPRMQVEL